MAKISQEDLEVVVRSVIEKWVSSTEQAKYSLQTICEEKIRTTMVSILAYIEKKNQRNERINFQELRTFIFDTGQVQINNLQKHFTDFNIGFTDKQILPIKPIRNRNNG